MRATRSASKATTATKRALRLPAVGPMGAMPVSAMWVTLFRGKLAMGLRPVWGSAFGALGGVIVAALPAAILRGRAILATPFGALRLALFALVAAFAALAPVK